MPEGNTIHRLARAHTRDFAGRRIAVSSPQGRFAREARRLDGRRFLRADAYGKHLFHHWSGGLVVHVHLGHGRMVLPPSRSDPDAAADRPDAPGDAGARAGSHRAADVRGDSRFARRRPARAAGHGSAARGLRPRARVGGAARGGRRRTVGDALLDQRVLAGVGNIYRNEALFLAGIHPLRPSGGLTAAEWERLWRATRRLMRRGVTQSETRTVVAAEPPHPLAGRGAEDDFYVYQQEACRRCASPIDEFPLSARRMFACPRCQPRRRS